LYLWFSQKNIQQPLKEKTIDYVLRSTWMAVQKMYNEEAGRKDSTMATGFALISIDPEDGTPSTALGPKMGMEATSLSRTLKTMESKGLIERKPNPEDGRGVLIHLTEFGKEMRDFSKSVVLRFDEAVKENISEEELKTFIKVAHTITELINNKRVYKSIQN
jgi:MarR family transcriptional regulator, organic hydroperoxide resistance regulator